MEMSGQSRIAASREKVWAALNDPAVLRASIPGCQSLEKTSDTEMTATVQAKVGPVKAVFNGHVTLSNIDPPNGYTITGEGKGGVAGFAKGAADVKLTPDGDGTVLSYKVNAQVGGKLAQIGGRLIDATAKQMADQFFAAFAANVAGTPPAPQTESPPAAVDESPPMTPDDDAGEIAVIADVIRDPEVTAEAVEERLEAAAGRGVLGGPYMWGLLALVVVIVAILILR
ncbi:MAG TPA: carbon monoxide dehydrogenase subunit G [Bauldia sp.]|nr:carbon monoxide dehydrogenase subunit G [Bauldia sp.]